MPDQPTRLTIGIIGAGIAGLGAAVALRKAGHEVELFEQSHFKYEAGAAITITPNGVVVFKHWDIDPSDGECVVSTHYEMVDGTTLVNQAHMPLDGLAERYGNPMLHFHRVHLHELLRHAATDPSRDGVPATIHLGSKSVDIDCDKGLIIFADGRQVQKDLIIVADGIKTHFIPAITGHEIALVRNGRSAYRGLIPFSSIHAHSELDRIFKNVKPGFWVPNKDFLTQVVTYPCGNGELLNMVLLHQTLPKNVDKVDWSNPATSQYCIEATADFHPLVHELLKLSDDTKVQTFHARDPLPVLTNGRAVIIGDAAATHQPQHAQGGSLALECGATLGMLLSADVKPADDSPGSRDAAIKERLAMYDDLMKFRVHLTQLVSDCVPYNPNDPWKVQARQRLEALTKDKQSIPATDYPPFGPDVRDLLYYHNVVDKTNAFMRERNLSSTVS